MTKKNNTNQNNPSHTNKDVNESWDSFSDKAINRELPARGQPETISQSQMTPPRPVRPNDGDKK